MPSQFASLQTDHSVREAVQLHYFDWLRVIVILGVFLFHAVHPFDPACWLCQHAEKSEAATYFLDFLFPWGMPLFLLMAGAGSWFALQRRTERQHADERFKRPLIPFICGTILLMPIMLFLEWNPKTQTGVLTVSFAEFVFNHNPGFSPRWFGSLDYHLWFLGFLFSFTLITLPLFRWLRGPSGQRLIARLAAECERRGGILLFGAMAGS